MPASLPATQNTVYAHKSCCSLETHRRGCCIATKHTLDSPYSSEATCLASQVGPFCQATWSCQAAVNPLPLSNPPAVPVRLHQSLSQSLSQRASVQAEHCCSNTTIALLKSAIGLPPGPRSHCCVHPNTSTTPTHTHVSVNDTPTSQVLTQPSTAPAHTSTQGPQIQSHHIYHHSYCPESTSSGTAATTTNSTPHLPP
jgi:hypothetical protein